jgi:ParB family chromosome partitioning protein
MSEIEPSLENDHTVERPVREGLPPNYRMRAETHYVEQLDTAHPSPVRLIEARSIDVRGDEPRVSAPFMESIRRYGILQPILVQPRGNRFRLIAGRKRLVAAHAAGLREVPCLVQRVDEDQANLLAEAANTPAGDGPAPAIAPQGAETAALEATDQLAQTLMALATSANLLSGGSALTSAVAADLVKAEAARALQLLTAHRVLGNEAFRCAQ